MNGLNHVFLSRLATLEAKCQELRQAPVRKKGNRWPKEKLSGVYMFSENGEPVYVGRSRNIRDRYAAHTAKTHYSASFAFLLAREKTGYVANYRAGEGRKELLEDGDFSRFFHEARERIRRMDFQYVVEGDPVTQALLEIYCSISLGTERYNSFGTH